MPLQRIVPRKRRAAAADDRFTVVPSRRLQMSNRVALPVKRLVAPPGPTLPQSHVDFLDPSLRGPPPSTFLVVRSWVHRTTSRLRRAGGWARGRDSASLGAALPSRVGLVRALDHLFGVPGSRDTRASSRGNLHLPH